MKDNKRRVAVVCDFQFWKPELGSHTRVRNLVEELCTEVTLIVVYLGSFTPYEISAASSELGVSVVALGHGRQGPYNNGQSSSEEDERTALFLHFAQEWKPDAVIFEYVRLAPLQARLPREIRSIVDTMDVMSQRAWTFIRHAERPSIYKSAAEEAEELSRFDLVLAISESDSRYLRETLSLTNIMLVTMSNRALVGSGAVRQNFLGQQQKLHAIFVGGRNRANQLGLIALRRFWPIVAKNYDLSIVGQVDAQSFSGFPGVNILGKIDDLAALYASADVALNPVYIGGGVKIKVLEALANGVPCVSSQEGARGLDDAVRTSAVRVADSSLTFVGQMKILEDLDVRQAASAAALSFSERHLSSDHSFRDLICYLNHA